MMLSNRNSNTNSAQALVYQIRLKGHLDQQWLECFENSSLTLEGETTLLTCPVIDQAALYGLLRKVRDLGIPLLSVTQVKPD